MNLIDGKLVAKQIKDNAYKKAHDIQSKFGTQVGLAVIVVGENEATSLYIRNKIRACDEVGIKHSVVQLPATIEQDELKSVIKDLANDNQVHGILVQLPLPSHLNADDLLDVIPAGKDVDGFTAVNVGNLALNKSTVIPCTPAGIMEMLHYYKIDVCSKHAVVIGRSNIVGKPISLLLLKENATVTICHSHTENLKDECRRADILVVACGVPRIITADMVKEGAVIIDVGINRIDGKLCGDVDFDNVKAKTSYITPVPGGVGQTTVACLMKNVCDLAELQLSSRGDIQDEI